MVRLRDEHPESTVAPSNPSKRAQLWCRTDEPMVKPADVTFPFKRDMESLLFAAGDAAPFDVTFSG